MRSREVPFSEAKDIVEPASPARGNRYKLKNRRVCVGRCADRTIEVRFVRLSPSRKVVVTQFNVSEEAAVALYFGLREAFKIDPATVGKPMSIAQSAARLHERYGDTLAKLDDASPGERDGGKC
jgi:hypothetical protein